MRRSPSPPWSWSPSAPGAAAGARARACARGRARAAAARALALLLLVALPACAGWWGGIEEPEVEVTNVEPAGVGLLEQDLDVGLRIRNPNEFPLEIVALRFELELGGQGFARGTHDLRVTVPAWGEREVRVPARARTVGLLRGLAGVGTGDVSWAVEGTLLLDQPQAQEVGFESESEPLDL